MKIVKCQLKNSALILETEQSTAKSKSVDRQN